MKKYILFYKVKKTRLIVKDLNGRIYQSTNHESNEYAKSIALKCWLSYQLFVLRVLITGKNKYGLKIKL